MAENTITGAVAWWGAILATIVFIWDIYKWKTSGSRLKIDVSPNMKYFMTGININDDKEYIVVNITNIGKRQTTITHVAMQYFESWFYQVIRRPKSSFIVSTPNPSQPVPYKLEPGTVWMAIIEQNLDIVKMAKKARLFCLIYDAQHNRPKMQRIIIKEKKPKK